MPITGVGAGAGWVGVCEVAGWEVGAAAGADVGSTGGGGADTAVVGGVLAGSVGTPDPEGANGLEPPPVLPSASGLRSTVLMGISYWMVPRSVPGAGLPPPAPLCVLPAFGADAAGRVFPRLTAPGVCPAPGTPALGPVPTG